MAITQLVYISHVAPSLSTGDFPFKVELQKIHEKAVRKNATIGVTGILLYSSGHFLQVLEGHQLVVNRLYQKIAIDSRHINVEKLACYASETRIFDDWNMGMLNLDDQGELDRDQFRAVVSSLRQMKLDYDIATRTVVMNLLVSFKNRLGSNQECANA